MKFVKKNTKRGFFCTCVNAVNIIDGVQQHQRQLSFAFLPLQLAGWGVMFDVKKVL